MRDAELGAAAGGCAPAARGQSGAESREAGGMANKKTPHSEALISENLPYIINNLYALRNRAQRYKKFSHVLIYLNF